MRIGLYRFLLVRLLRYRLGSDLSSFGIRQEMPALESEKQGDVLIIRPQHTRIQDEARIEPLGRELLEVANSLTEGKLLLNFKEVTFMSSAMLGKLIQLSKHCRAGGIDLKLCGISQEIMKIFAMMKLDRMFDIRRDQAAALKAFSETRSE